MGDTKKQCDWQGEEIEGVEPPEKVVKVWEISPAMQSGFDATIIRDYYEMLDFVSEKFDVWLGDYTESELETGVKLELKLIEMTVARYRYKQFAHQDDPAN